MRLAFYICPSNYPYFEADSIYVFNRLLIRKLVNQVEGIKVMVVGPRGMPEIHPKVELVKVKMGVSKLEVRLGFYWSELERVMKRAKPDWVIVQMPEQALNVAAMVKDQLGLECKVASYVHYLPFVIKNGKKIEYEESMDRNGMGRLVTLRILEGVVASDLVLTCSRFAAGLLKRAGEELLSSKMQLEVVKLPPPIGREEVGLGLGARRAEVPTIIYNHRLYDEYGTREIFELVKEVFEKRETKFKVLVTNPTGKRVGERARLNPAVEENLNYLRRLPFVEVKHFKRRDDYFRAVGKSWLGLGPKKRQALWSMGVMDVVACGKPVICWDVGAFREMGIPERALVKTKEEFKRKLEQELKRPISRKVESEWKKIARRYEAAKVARKFWELLTRKSKK